MLKAFSIVLLAIFGGMVVVFLNPDFFLKNKINYENIVLHSGGKISLKAEDVLRDVYSRLKSFKLFDSNQKYDVYIMKSFGQYGFFARFSKESYVWVNPLNGKILVARADFENNKAYRKGCDVVRRVDAVLTKGIVLSVLRNKLGFLKYIALKEWKKQGIAERVAGETELFLTSELCEKRQDMNFLRYQYMMAVDTLMKGENMDVKDVLNTKDSFEGVKRKFERRYCR